jgi:peptidoglycan/LPS O-acetylase OafA/YrhL
MSQVLWTSGAAIPTKRRVSGALKPQRRADLDWLRVGALGLLILYHVGLVFAPWDWHVHSRHTYDWLASAALATNPWRLTLLFLVSGCAVRLMARRLTAGEVLRARAARLLPPLALGVFLLAPLQSWLEALDKGWWAGGFGGWWIAEYSPNGWANGVPLNHLWFVLYICAYTLAAVALMTRPKALAKLEALLERALTGPWLFILPIAYLALARQLLFPWFGLTNQLPVDWYNHAMSLGAFVFGFAMVGREALWRELERQRRRALALALAALPLLIIMYLHPGGTAFGSSVRNMVFAVDQWATIAALLGYGSRYLRTADGPVLRYLTEAIFPCYLAHQTILVAAAFLVKPHGWSGPAEAALMVGVTLLGSLAVYEIVRRIDPIRPLWGLKLAARPAKGRRPAMEPSAA